MGCAFDDTCTAFALDALEPEEARAFAAHLPGCADCSDAVARARADLAAVASSAPPAPLPAGGFARLAERFAQRRKAAERGSVVLVAECFQRDFLGPLAADERPPRTHVGTEAVGRVLGDDPQSGALAALLEAFAARLGRDTRHSLLHVIDFHERDDPATAEHFAALLPHCLAGEPGARLLAPLAGLWNAPGSQVAELEDCQGAALLDLLRQVARGHPDPRRSKYAFIGAMTEHNLGYHARKARQLEARAALCPAFCAASDPARQEPALQALATRYGVEILPDGDALAEWLEL